jgi:hypothetical protein
LPLPSQRFVLWLGIVHFASIRCANTGHVRRSGIGPADADTAIHITSMTCGKRVLLALLLLISASLDE